ERNLAPSLVQGRRIDPESGMPETEPRRTDRSAEGGARPTDRTTDRLGRPNHWGGAGQRPRDSIRGGIGVDRVGRADPHREATREGEGVDGAGSTGEGATDARRSADRSAAAPHSS